MDFSITPVSTPYLDPTQSASSGISNLSGPSQTGSSSPSPVAAPVAAHKPIQDTVKLSTTAQVESMKQGGATVSQIAANLGLTTAEVNQDLGTTSSTSSSEASILAALSAKK